MPVEVIRTRCSDDKSCKKLFDLYNVVADNNLPVARIDVSVDAPFDGYADLFVYADSVEDFDYVDNTLEVLELNGYVFLEA